MQAVRRLITFMVAVLMAAPSSAFADGRHVVDPATLAAAVARHVEQQDAIRVGIAAFADVARASRRQAPASGSVTQVDIGSGLRVRIPGAAGTLRVDIARGVRDGADALTIGWQY